MTERELASLKANYQIVGNSESLNLALATAVQVAKTDLSVLVVGESGVGKEVISRIIHDKSTRKSKKYLAVNCGSIPEGTIDSELFGHEKGSFTGAVGERDGYFAVANGGTLFLDEVGEMPLATQARLLRVLETGEYIRVGASESRRTNVRIVAATNVNMEKAVREGRFREDLFYRLGTIPIKMPALRDRADDIVLLFKHFAMKIADAYNMPSPVTLNPEAAKLMKAYPWPGNVRQLKNVAEQLSVLLTDSQRIVTPEILERYVPQTLNNNQIATIEHGKTTHDYEMEREIIFKMLIDLHNEVADLKKRTDGDAKALTRKEGWDEAVEIMNNE